MALQDRVSTEVWDVIRDNYGKGSYTSAILNLLQYINEIVRDKSGSDRDGTSLMDKSFLGENPILRINKFQTQTEKDIQSGVGYILKGACLAIRNPRSHERYNDNQQDCEVIILFLSYILSFINKSSQPSLIDDWLDFIFDDNFPETEEFAKKLIGEIQLKKRYDILVMIFRNRDRVKDGKLNYLIVYLFNSLNEDEYKSFIDGMNKELVKCQNDEYLKGFLLIFPPDRWNDLDVIVRLRIENMILKSIEKGTMIEYYNQSIDDADYYPNDDGNLATWANEHILHFSNLKEVIFTLSKKLQKMKVDYQEYLYAITYFSNVIFNEDYALKAPLIDVIREGIIYKRFEIINYVRSRIEICNDKKWIDAFGDVYSSID